MCIRDRLWMAWKDIKNPYAGGAEVVNGQLAQRLVRDGHEVIFLVRGFADAPKEETRHGYRIIRVGDFHSVYWEAYRYYKKHLQGWADLVIEEVNTIPFFCNWYVRERNILFFHQLCREIWFYEMGSFKGIFGYVAETIYLMLLGNRDVITVSDSSKRDLSRYGFKRNRIKVIGEGIELEPVTDLSLKKFEQPTMLSLGALRPMKRTDHIVRAFELAKKDLPNLRLVVAGDPSGNDKVRKVIEASPYRDSIEFLGKVSREKKIELMQRAHLVCVASVKEGWGLVVTEANSQGTPAVAYDIDGFRDSIRHGETGLLTEKNDPESLAKAVVSLLSDMERYAMMRKNGWEWSKEKTFEQSYADFLKAIAMPSLSGKGQEMKG